MRSDATAAIGICKREGLGRVRHLATSDLWVQQLLRRKKLSIEKWPTEENPSDILTKGVSREKSQTLCQIMGMQAQGGRPLVAPTRDGTSPRYGPVMISSDEVDSDCEEAC